MISYLDEEGVGQGVDHVDQAVQDDEDVHSVSIFPQNADTGPEVMTNVTTVSGMLAKR